MEKNEVQEAKISVGPPLLGLFLAATMCWSLWSQHMYLVYLIIVSLVVLALGTSFIHKKYE